VQRVLEPVWNSLSRIGAGRAVASLYKKRRGTSIWRVGTKVEQVYFQWRQRVSNIGGQPPPSLLPQPKSNLLHFNLKIRHGGKIFNDFSKKSTDRKASSLHSKDNIYYNGSQFIETWQHQYLLRCNFTNASA